MQNPKEITQEQQFIELCQSLISNDTPKNLLADVTEMYVAYNQTDLADSKAEREGKSCTYMILLDFLGGLTQIK